MKNNEVLIKLQPIVPKREEITLSDVNDGIFNAELDNLVAKDDNVTLIFKQDITSISIGKIFKSINIKMESVEFPESLDVIKTRTFLGGLLRDGIKINKGGEIIIENDVLVYVPNIKGEIEIPNGVKTIGAGVFKETQITNVILPSSLERIETEAFASTKFVNIELPDNLKYIGDSAFERSSITNLKFPENLEYISNKAFHYCYGIEEVNIPDSVVKIGDLAFYECEGLKSVNLGKGIEELGNGVFASCNKLSKFKGKYVSEKGKIIVRDNVLLSVAGHFKQLDVPEGIEEIAPYVFCGHSWMAKDPSKVVVTLPSSIKVIGDKAFHMTDISIDNRFPQNLEEIGCSAFASNKKLTEVDLPKSVMKVGEKAFDDCPKIRKFSGKFASKDGKFLVADGVLVANVSNDCTLGLNIPKAVTTIGAGTFCRYRNGEVKLHKGITDINKWAFNACQFTSFKFPSTLKIIRERAFYSTVFPVELELPEGLEIIEDDAFNDITLGKPEITLPSTLKKIGLSVFKLRAPKDKPLTLTFKSSVPPEITIGYNRAYWCEDFHGRILRIPKDSKEAYELADWMKCLKTYLNSNDFEIIYY